MRKQVIRAVVRHVAVKPQRLTVETRHVPAKRLVIHARITRSNRGKVMPVGMTAASPSGAPPAPSGRSLSVMGERRWGLPVRCIETDDGKRLWLCECAKFQERAARHVEG